ncbi:hypothetical protein AOLI_G00057250 [Acnodon oligacanthus]
MVEGKKLDLSRLVLPLRGGRPSQLPLFHLVTVAAHIVGEQKSKADSLIQSGGHMERDGEEISRVSRGTL